MLKQYQEIKARHKDCILFFRLGDFYEMFYDDARKACGILNVVLTSRGKDTAGKIPMCGIPFHAADTYVSKLIKAGMKVAICEQLEDPAQAKTIVKRDVIRVITSGTFIDETNHDPRYILSLSLNDKAVGLAFTDTSSGTIQTNQYSDINKAVEIISKLSVCECIYSQDDEDKIKEMLNHPLLRNKHIPLTPFEGYAYNFDLANKTLCDHFAVHNLSGFGISDMTGAISSSGALLEYLRQMNKMPMRHIDKLTLYSDTDHVFISPAAHYGLELEELFKTIDNTLTPLGKRKLRSWLYHPLKSKTGILERQEAVELLKENPQIQQELSRLLKNTPDIEKNLYRIACGCATVKDLLGLRSVLCRLPEIQEACGALAKANPYFSIPDLPEIRKLLDEAINPEVLLSNYEGKIIKRNYDKELDGLIDIQENALQWLKEFQTQEIKRSGINSLKIGFTNVFGYYVEISNSNLKSVPADYIRKQTLVNAERFITPALKEFEEKMLNADENLLKAEKMILSAIYEKLLKDSKLLHIFSASIAALDAIYSLSVLALSQGYVRPAINENTTLDIKNGRHPVVEKISPEPFVPNDTLLDCEDNHLIILTGPNMAGKSTYIRQTAILVIMAQIGSFIPAESAQIGIVDKIFTRIGAHDEISKGQSTFMVEMTETANILNNLTPRSLIVLDEIGRGTSTYDGLSLAWAVAEHLNTQKIRTMFATHFHELTALAEENHGIKNYNVAVKKWRDEVVFLHKIIPGGSDQSYGIYVAKLAGIPNEVVKRSKQILTRLELHGLLQDKILDTAAKETQLSLFTNKKDTAIEEIKQDLNSIDINSLTPLRALNKIQEWQNKIKDK